MSIETKTKRQIHAELCEQVKAGLRVTTDTSICTEESPTSGTCVHHWRTISCDSDTDICECSRCGRQIVCACDFDEEYA